MRFLRHTTPSFETHFSPKGSGLFLLPKGQSCYFMSSGLSLLTLSGYPACLLEPIFSSDPWRPGRPGYLLVEAYFLIPSRKLIARPFRRPLGSAGAIYTLNSH